MSSGNANQIDPSQNPLTVRRLIAMRKGKKHSKKHSKKHGRKY